MSRRRREVDRADGSAKPAQIRCAVYTRKSSEEGLDQEFNSLDAQREAGEAFIASQKSQGWTCLPHRYDDGGFSGGSMERPALERLLADIEKGQVDCVVVYKVDRLSRSLMDFARIMQAFESKGVSFVSVTQQFNTTSSMGRLTLNILLSFAQFEREIIGERIRDKVAAQKKRGKWAGGVPVLGYDVDRSGGSPRLVVNAKEAAHVRDIFSLYLEMGSLQPVAVELGRRGWANKRRLTAKGVEKGGRPFDKATLYTLLTNPILTGKIVHKGDMYKGEHEAVVDEDLFERVQQQLGHNGRTGGVEVRNKYGALLRGLLRCGHCDGAMTHTFTRGKGSRMYRYYRCVKVIKNGCHACPSTTIPAGEMERVVIDEVRAIGTDTNLVDKVVEEMGSAGRIEAESLAREQRELRQERSRREREVRDLAVSTAAGPGGTERLAQAHQRLTQINERLPLVESRLAEIKATSVDRAEVARVMGEFDGLWASLKPREQARVLALLVERVVYDAKAGTVSVTLRPTCIQTLRSRKEHAA